MAPTMARPSLARVRKDIVTCSRCPRLREYCQRIGREKRAAFRHDTYWAKPVPGFGDPQARIVLVGLAPAAHGANRTGRVFTGDGGGGSGDFLMEALYANGLSNLTTSQSIDDGLTLTDAWIMAAVRCAPPDNKPTPSEIAACAPHLNAELDALPNVCVYVALGGIAWNACWRLITARHRDRLRAEGRWPKARPRFEHDGVVRLPGAPTLVGAYHPSRQNTFTGRLTQSMLRAVFRTARREADRAVR